MVKEPEENNISHLFSKKMCDSQYSQQLYRNQRDAHLRKLSVDLIKTYTLINEVNYIKTSCLRKRATSTQNFLK